MRYIGILFLAVMLAAACYAQGTAGPLAFQIGAELQQRALAPSPGPGATNQSKKSVIGQGKTMVDTGDPKNLFWSEPVDISGTGQVVNADLLWDSSAKILYVFAKSTVRCSHGKSTDTSLLVAIYGKKNYLGKPVGAGWWMADLQANQCQAPMAALYGCKFASSGQDLACGRAEIDTRVNDMAIVETTRF